MIIVNDRAAVYARNGSVDGMFYPRAAIVRMAFCEGDAVSLCAIHGLNASVRESALCYHAEKCNAAVARVLEKSPPGAGAIRPAAGSALVEAWNYIEEARQESGAIMAASLIVAISAPRGLCVCGVGNVSAWMLGDGKVEQVIKPTVLDGSTEALYPDGPYLQMAGGYYREQDIPAYECESGERAIVLAIRWKLAPPKVRLLRESPSSMPPSPESIMASFLVECESEHGVIPPRWA